MHRSDERSALWALAEAVGILPEYIDQTGVRQTTSDRTRIALLAALGHDAHDEPSAAMALALWRELERGRLLEPARVVRQPVPLALVAYLREHAGETVHWTVVLRDELGVARSASGTSHVESDGRLLAQLPHEPTLGYHALSLTVDVGGSSLVAEQSLIVVPSRCPSPADLLRGERVFGLTANLYTVRSARNWGVGDLTDLGALLDFAADAGAAFVGVNPLHALRNAGHEVSPYSPVSRLYRNELYVDVEAVPELATCDEARALLEDPATRATLDELRAESHVDYERVMSLKRRVLEMLHDEFRTRPDAARRAAYEAWCAHEGEPLMRFARFAAIDAHQRELGAGWWREWPEPLQDATSAEVTAFAEEHAAAIDFRCWLQFEFDRQLGEAARRGRVRGLPIGIYQDLAIGTSPAGSDAWAHPELFARGVSVGAPPDPLGPEGQNWGLPPVDPHRLAADGYRYWAALVRGAMRHGGALRIDHILGLFRQFWIPEGLDGRHGAYVRFPTDDLLGVLALEATRAGALVVGEDLGTVPPDVPQTLARWGILSSKVLYFEREWDGGFRSPRSYPRAALATANTHDLVPLAGFWKGSDLALRREVGLLRDDDELEAAERERMRDRAALVRLLVDEGVLDPEVARAGPDAVGELEMRAGVHVVLRRAPSWLVGIALDDLVGERAPVNVPGVGQDRFPSWTRRLSMSLEALRDDRAVRQALGTERVWQP